MTGPEGKGSTHRAGRNRPVQLIATTAARWSDEAEARFLDALADTANVTAAARAAGFSTEAIYRRKRRDAAFAAKWEAALAQGFDRLEMALVRAAADTMEGVAIDADRPFPAITVSEALNILKLHRRTQRGSGFRFGRQPRPRSLDEIRDGLLRKIAMVRKAHGKA